MVTMQNPPTTNRLASYRPRTLARPIIPQHIGEDFVDSKHSLQGIVRDNFLAKHGPIHRKFIYTPLKQDEVRFILLHYGEENSEIKCDIEYAQLKDVQGVYHALSYHWGTDYPTNRIWIRDERCRPKRPQRHRFADVVEQTVRQNKSDSGASDEWWFVVRDNLRDALRTLRASMKKDDEPMPVWVDAICINQDPADEAAREEKRGQINMMAQIYSSAYSVIIWLGEGSETMDRAMRFVQRIVRDVTKLDSYLPKVEDQRHMEDWMAFKELMKFKWFSRRWVVQEVALARKATVHCGKEAIDWDDFADGVSLFVNMKDRIVSHAKDPNSWENVAALGANVLVTAISDLSRKSEAGDVENHLVSIETLVSTLLFFEAQTPHDYIFSLLALARDTPQQYCPARVEHATLYAPFKIDIDYDIEAVELFRNFTKLCIETSESLDIICRHWAPVVPKKDQDGSAEEAAFPSWILKISDSPYGTATDTLQGRRAGDSLVGCSYRDKRKTYNAANGTKAKFRFGPQIPESPLSFRRTTTEASTSTSDSFYTDNIQASSPPSVSVSRRTTLNDMSASSISHKDFASAEPSPSQARVDGDPKGNEPVTGSCPPSPRPQPAGLIMERTSLGILNVMGVEIGKIQKRSESIIDSVPAKWLRHGGWIPTKPGQVPDTLVPDKLWRTLVANRGPDGQFPPRWYRRACTHCLTDRALMTTNYDLDTRGTPESDILAQFLSRVRSVVLNRQFFMGGKSINELTEFGLAPSRAKRGDTICVLAGCTVPVILRKQKHTQGQYEFIGEAYVHGKMDGEAMADHDPSDQGSLEERMEWFSLV